MGLRGPVKQYHKETRIDLTELQFTYLQAVAGNASVASVVRRLIDADRSRRLEEAARAKGRGRSDIPHAYPAKAR